MFKPEQIKSNSTVQYKYKMLINGTDYANESLFEYGPNRVLKFYNIRNGLFHLLN